MPILYSLRSHPDGFMMAKFDPDFNVAAIYHLAYKKQRSHDGHPAELLCECPAGVRPTCRHRHMVPIFTKANAIDTNRFYCYETQTWHRPIPTMTAGDDAATRAAELDAYETILGKRPNAVYQGVPIYEVDSLPPSSEPRQTSAVPEEGVDRIPPKGQPLAGEGPGPSTLAVAHSTSPSQEPGLQSPGRRGEPASSSTFRRLR